MLYQYCTQKNVDIYRNSQIKISFIFFKYSEQIINDIFYILFQWVCGWLLVDEKGTIFSHIKMRTSYFFMWWQYCMFCTRPKSLIWFIDLLCLHSQTCRFSWTHYPDSEANSLSFYTMINEAANTNFILIGLPLHHDYCVFDNRFDFSIVTRLTCIIEDKIKRCYWVVIVHVHLKTR